MKKLGIILLFSGFCLSLLAGCFDEGKNNTKNGLLLGSASTLVSGSAPGSGSGDKSIAPPSTVDATDGLYTDSIGINWKSVSDATGYAVYRSETKGGPFDKLSSMDTAEYTAGMQTGGATAPAKSASVTTTAALPQAVFQSDVDLSGLMFDIGLYVLAWQTPKIRIQIGTAVNAIVEFPGGWLGTFYKQSDVVSKINAAVGKTVCYPVDSNGKKYVKIVTSDGAIVISNANTTLSYIPVQYFLKSDAVDTTMITVNLPPVDNGGGTGGGDTGGGGTGGGSTGGGSTPSTPAVTYNFVDKSVTRGKHYYYVVTSVDAGGLESDYSAVDEGFAVSSDAPAMVANMKASDGASLSSVTLTWDAVPGASYYHVFRSDGKTSVQVGGDITGTAFEDTTVPAGLFSYKVGAYNAKAEGPYSDPDAGYRKITDEEFYVEYARSMDYSLNRLQIMKRSGTGKLGTETIQAENSGGTCVYNAGMQGFGALVTITFTDFCDLYMTFNGTQSTTADMSANGSLKDSTITVTGLYNGYVRYDIVIAGGAPGGGNYYVSQNGGAETTIPWNYNYK